jgi:pseudouridine synthase
MRLSDEHLQQLREGIELSDGRTRPARVVRLRDSATDTRFEITLTEGRNRQVRRMVEAFGAAVLSLVRVTIGPVHLGALPIGTWRLLRPSEVRALRTSASGILVRRSSPGPTTPSRRRS